MSFRIRHAPRGTARLAMAALAALTAAALHPGSAAGQNWRTVSLSRQTSSEEALDVRIEYAAGHLRVTPAGEGLLYRMNVRYDDDVFEPLVNLEGGRRLHLGLETRRHNLNLGKDFEGGEADLALAQGVPMDLRMELGALRADLDLGGLSMTGLHVQTGASATRLDMGTPNPVSMRRASFEVGATDFEARSLGNLNAEQIEVSAGVGAVTMEFSGAWRRDAEVSVEMRLGALRLLFPRGLGVRLERDTFLTSFDPEGLVRRGDAYYSPGWADAQRRVTVRVDAAFGGIEVDWIDPAGGRPDRPRPR